MVLLINPERDADLAEAFVGPGCGNWLAEAEHLHAVFGEFDWYALAGTGAEKLLHERLCRLVSCDEFKQVLAREQANSIAGERG